MIIGLIIVSSVCVAGAGFLTDMFNNYGVSAEAEQLSTVSKINQIRGNVSTYATRLSDSQIEVAEGGMFGVIRGAWDTVKLFLHLPSIFSAMLNDVAGLLHLPGWFTLMIVLIVMTVVVFQLIKYVTKVE